MGDGDSRMFERVRFWVIVLAVLALVVPAVVSYRRVYRDPPSALFWIRPAGDVSSVIETKDRHRLTSIYIGMAVREVAGGDIAGVSAPDELRDLATRESDSFMGNERPALVRTYIAYMSGTPLIASDYDVVLTRQELADLRAQATFVEYPKEIFAVVGDVGDGGVTLYTDSRQHNIYVVPDALRPER